MPRGFTIKLHGTYGEHDLEMKEACYRILLRYIKVQKNCCVCGKSKTMKRVKKLVSLYKKRNKWDDLDLAKLMFMNGHYNTITKVRTCEQRWMEMVTLVQSSMWC